ncbi:hypothetical protein [Collimonas silvisoli]|uniref:hypothetical protein n=1 Tax=Collimonas silvisoli TaxID=2825884 RepID=UPI001B8B84DE|nr:hypothetical protein [Collimonas silvisoli]
MAIQEMTLQEIDEVYGAVNWRLVSQGFIQTFAGSVAVAVGAASGPLGFGLVAVGGVAMVMGGTAMAAGIGDASNVGAGTVPNAP